MIRQLDVRRQQVLVEAIIVEISNAATKSTLDPEKTAGNSSGG